MRVASSDSPVIAQNPSATDRVADAVRHAAHVSHEARLMKSMARDAGEEGVHAAKRAIRRAKRAAETLEDLRDEAAHYVKRQPFRAVSIVAGFGLIAGMIVGWVGGRRRHA